MLYQGETIRVEPVSTDEGLFNLVFDNPGSSVNTLNQATLAELRQALDALSQQQPLQGLVISSTKSGFIAGADVTEFHQMFARDEADIQTALAEMNQIFNALEDLPCPTVSAINGIALGGGFELCLATDYRVMAPEAKVGLPEVKLGIHPGWGGTVRLPRLIGVDNANEWICGGGQKNAKTALREGAVDAVVAADLLNNAALDLIRKCNAGDFDIQQRRLEKTGPIRLSQMEQVMAFESAKGVIGAKAGPHYPAPLTALSSIQQHANLTRDKALAVEGKGVAQLAKSPVTAALVGLFLKDQALKKISAAYQKQSTPVAHAAVLGAGIMGGGIAYQSASKNVPVLMKDINEAALQLGQDEAGKLLAGQLKRGRIDVAEMGQTISRITPTLSYGDFDRVQLVVEAVVENPKVKQAVLAEAEQALPEDVVLTSNTSSICIDTLATSLKRPENFCGMHFFNPVHRMPLVEVIRGSKTSETTLARTVTYARQLGKTPIVVNDCPGFLVNRILFPYLAGFIGLIRDGADFRHVDKVMERFGWPMGPAYLLDVVGMDTACHAAQVMATGYPDRMQISTDNVLTTMYQQQRLGQKNAQGFYRYETDRKGKPQKLNDPSVDKLIAPVVGKTQAFTDEQIIQRMMVPLCIETARCLEEGIVSTAAEADMALILGLGFPPFLGGPLHYLDQMGLDVFCAQADALADQGALYTPTHTMREMATSGAGYFN